MDYPHTLAPFIMPQVTSMHVTSFYAMSRLEPSVIMDSHPRDSFSREVIESTEHIIKLIAPIVAQLNSQETSLKFICFQKTRGVPPE